MIVTVIAVDEKLQIKVSPFNSEESFFNAQQVSDYFRKHLANDGEIFAPSLIFVLKNAKITDSAPHLISIWRRGQDFYDKVVTIENARNLLQQHILKTNDHTEIGSLLEKVFGAKNVMFPDSKHVAYDEPTVTSV